MKKLRSHKLYLRALLMLQAMLAADTFEKRVAIGVTGIPENLRDGLDAGLLARGRKKTSLAATARDSAMKGPPAYRRNAYTLALPAPPTGKVMSSSKSRVIRAKPVKAFLASSADIWPDKAAEQQFSAH